MTTWRSPGSNKLHALGGSVEFSAALFAVSNSKKERWIFMAIVTVATFFVARLQDVVALACITLSSTVATGSLKQEAGAIGIKHEDRDIYF